MLCCIMKYKFSWVLSEKSVKFNQITWHHTREDCKLHRHYPDDVNFIYYVCESLYRETRMKIRSVIWSVFMNYELSFVWHIVCFWWQNDSVASCVLCTLWCYVHILYIYIHIIRHENWLKWFQIIIKHT